jgi:hypothetical protein
MASAVAPALEGVEPREAATKEGVAALATLLRDPTRIADLAGEDRRSAGRTEFVQALICRRTATLHVARVAPLGLRLAPADLLAGLSIDEAHQAAASSRRGMS